MSAVIISFPDRRQEVAGEFAPDYFGNCPKCRRSPQMLNVEREHYMVCFRCSVYWCIGSNIFSAWRYENAADWSRNLARLSRMRNVEPLILPEALNDQGAPSLPPELNSYEAYAAHRDADGGDERDGAA